MWFNVLGMSVHTGGEGLDCKGLGSSFRGVGSYFGVVV